VNRRRLLQLGSLAWASAQAQDHAGLLARLELPKGKIRLVIDSDAYNEVDDAFAIAHALLSPERCEVEAIYAGPFVNKRAETPKEGMQQSYDEILKVLDKLGQKATVLKGSTRYLRSDSDGPRSPAVDDLIERALAATEPLWVASLGCPTNIAAALIAEPRIVDKISVIWIGGQQHHSASANDYNIGQDYFASKTLFDSGVALVEVLGYLISEQMRTTTWELERFMKGRSPLADYLYETVVGYYNDRREGEDHAWSKPIWDLAVSGFLLNPEWVATQITPSPILRPDITWDHDASRHPIRVSTRVERDAIFTDLFRKLAA